MNEHQVVKLEHIRGAFARAKEWQPESANGRIDKAREIGKLMSELERCFKIPQQEKMLEEFGTRYPEVLSLYRDIFATGDV